MDDITIGQVTETLQGIVDAAFSKWGLIVISGLVFLAFGIGYLVFKSFSG